MRRQNIFTIGLILILIMASLSGCARRNRGTPVPQAQPQTTVQTISGGAVLFQDDFQDGQAQEWQVSSGWYVNQNGDVYTFGASGQGAAWLPQGNTWSDYVFRSMVRLDSGLVALNFRLTSSGRYVLAYRQDGLYLSKEIAGQNAVTLTQLAAPAMSTWHWFTVGLYGGRIQLYVDRQLWLDYTDTSPLSGGTIGYGTIDGSQAYVDNVLITRQDGPLPAGTVVQQPVSGGQAPAPAGPSLSAAPPVSNEPAQPIAAPSGPASVVFTVEGQNQASIDAGQCVTTQWTVTNALEVYYQNQAVAAANLRDECPGQTTVYSLEVVDLSGNAQMYSVTVNVNIPPAGGQAPPLNGPDIAITDVTVPATAMPEAINVQMTVTNQGDQAAGWFNVRWYSVRDSIVGCSWEVESLAAGRNRVLSCTFPGYPQAGTYEWHMAADADDEVNETNEGNNDSTGSISIRAAEPQGELMQPVQCHATATQTSVTITWEIQAGAVQDNFNIYQAGTSLEGWTGPNGTSFTVTGLMPAVQYDFDVRAVLDGVESAASVCGVTITTNP